MRIMQIIKKCFIGNKSKKVDYKDNDCKDSPTRFKKSDYEDSPMKWIEINELNIEINQL